MACPLGGFRCIFPLFDSVKVNSSIHSKNFLPQNKTPQKREALVIRMSFLVLEKMAENFTHYEEEKASI